MAGLCCPGDFRRDCDICGSPPLKRLSMSRALKKLRLEPGRLLVLSPIVALGIGNGIFPPILEDKSPIVVSMEEFAIEWMFWLTWKRTK
jgi:hypothetical protein